MKFMHYIYIPSVLSVWCNYILAKRVHYNGHLFLYLIEIKPQCNTEQLTEQSEFKPVTEGFKIFTYFQITQSEGE